MRICMLSTDYLPRPGGVAAHVYGLSKALQELGHEVHILTVACESCPAGTAIENGLNTTRIKADAPYVHGILAEAVLTAKSAFRRLKARAPIRCLTERHAWLGIPLLELERACRFDIVHCHSLDPDITASRWVPQVVRIFTNHTSMFLASVAAGRGQQVWRSLSHFDWIITPSHEISSVTCKIGADPGTVTTIPNGVDTAAFRPVCADEYRRSLGYNSDDIVVFTARRLVPKNGVRYLIEAAGEFLRKAPNSAVLIAGDGPERSELEAFAVELGIAAKVRFWGNADRAEIPLLTNSADIVVLPSLMEATSIAGLEAMACGKPLIGTNVGGIPELIADGENGLIVPAKDAAALARAVIRLCEDREYRKAMGHKGRIRAEREFSWHVIAEKTAEVYEKAICIRSKTC